MQTQKNYIKIFFIFLAVLILGIIGYLYFNFSDINIQKPNLLKETFEESYYKGQVISFSNKGESFNEKIVDVRYFNNNRYVFFVTQSYDIKNYYLIDQSTEEDLLLGENKYLTTDLFSEKEVLYIEEKNTLFIKTFTNDLVGAGFNGVLIVDFKNNSVIKKEVMRKDFCLEENERIKLEVNSLFEGFNNVQSINNDDSIQNSKSKQSDTKQITAEWNTYKNEQGIEMFKYPADFTVEKIYHYNIRNEIDYTTLSIKPPKSLSSSVEDIIWVGTPKVSLCSDVPNAKKCAGSGKDSFTVTFTYSSNSQILNVFDLIVSTMN